MGIKAVRCRPEKPTFNYCFLLISHELDARQELSRSFNSSLLSIAIRNEPLTDFS